MALIKKVWLHESDNNFSLTIESNLNIGVVHVSALSFPENPTPEHPRRHTTCLGSFDIQDLILIHDAINTELGW